MNDFIQSSTWKGGAGTGDEIEWLGPSLGRCRTKSDEKPTPNVAKSNRVRGAVVTWKPDRGFGFVRVESTGHDDVFLHISDVERAGIDQVQYGQRLEFELATDKISGKAIAVNIVKI